MSRQSTMLGTAAFDKKHQAAVAAKYEKIQGTEALIEEWLTAPNCDMNYVRRLRRNLHCYKAQLKALGE